MRVSKNIWNNNTTKGVDGMGRRRTTRKRKSSTVERTIPVCPYCYSKQSGIKCNDLHSPYLGGKPKYKEKICINCCKKFKIKIFYKSSKNGTIPTFSSRRLREIER